MKTLTLLLAFSIISVLGLAQGKTKLGVIARVNASTFRTEDHLRTREISYNPEVGLNLSIPASPSVGINIQGLYTTTGGRFGTFLIPRMYDLRLRYAKLPITLVLGKGDFKLHVGYYEAYLLDKVTIGSKFMPNHSFLATHWIANRHDRGAILGFNVDLHFGGEPNKLLFTALGTYGLRSVGKYDWSVLHSERNTSISSGFIYNF